MKIIDILNKKANDSLYNVKNRIKFGNEFCVDEHLNNEVEVIKENKEIEGLNAYKLIEKPYMASLLRGNQFDKYMELLKQSELEIVEKIDELVRAVNKLIKESEEK